MDGMDIVDGVDVMDEMDKGDDDLVRGLMNIEALIQCLLTEARGLNRMVRRELMNAEARGRGGAETKGRIVR